MFLIHNTYERLFLAWQCTYWSYWMSREYLYQTLTFCFCFLCVLKVSEYPFNHNKNMLKNMTVLLYTYFYNISLNALRPTFFNIYNLPFWRSSNIGKIRVKVGPKTTFPIFWAPAPTELQFSIIFFHWYVANQETNKTVPAIFFFPNIFWIIYF